ncbi:hypothetical protein IPC297_16515 [Pseudomonas aeruginosa]|nr:hypothetical protein IPC336_20490 [Pseudomonas aeruginosa]RQE59237.1 hypothetical protein IPC297_16515 [Pseudomonas aeruginosa]
MCVGRIATLDFEPAHGMPNRTSHFPHQRRFAATRLAHDQRGATGFQSVEDYAARLRSFGDQTGCKMPRACIDALIKAGVICGCQEIERLAESVA